jgi:FlaA1/EpsC-like NDP-sugar epimerase
MLKNFLGIPRYQKRIISVFVDYLLIAFSFWGGYWIRLDDLTPIKSLDHWLLLGLLSTLTVCLFVKLGLYRAVLRYVSFRVLLTVFFGVLFSTFLLVICAFYFSIFLPRSTSMIYFSFALILIGGARLFFRMVLYGIARSTKHPVLIYGAGASGRQLQHALNHSSDYTAVAFIDDDISLKSSSIQGLNIYDASEISALVDRYKIQKILISMPSIAANQRQKVLKVLAPFPCEILSIPSMTDLVTGAAEIDQLGQISTGDLLGRDSVLPDAGLMRKNIESKVVMVIGAGGSIGSELSKQMLIYNPRILVLFDHAEFSLYKVEKELVKLVDREKITTQIVPILGSIQNSSRLLQTMKSFSVQTLFHAAAYKHVPLVEYNVVEGIRNNIFGTLNCAKTAIEAKVESFVLISTDKAVRPTNVMGASKRIAELILQALSIEEHATVFAMVRFGNVLGSSGSVVPLFRKQIANGGPVTVTHPEITRYFMTIPEASQLVIQAGAMGERGEVFVLDMGSPIKIADLATKMINLSGFSVKSVEEPNGDISIEFSGLRPGEKLYEELLIGDKTAGTSHDRIMSAHEVMLPWCDLKEIISELDIACSNYNLELIRDILIKAPTGFDPSDEICDLVWSNNTKELVV